MRANVNIPLSQIEYDQGGMSSNIILGIVAYINHRSEEVFQGKHSDQAQFEDV